ncbi:hypothetical protein N0V92_001755 [Colletotrichum tropicale]|nr:hypothetical protein N0V92_001755 [Colletotrichum tropicale]
MLFTQVTAILGFAIGLASAVDIHYYVNANSCSGARTSCTNIGSNVCCLRSLNGGTPARSILFTMDRRISVRGYGAAAPTSSSRRTATPNHCMSRADGGTFTGAQWGEPTLRKRAPEVDQCPAGEGKCNETVRPDTVMIADGTEYDVQGLDEAIYDELVRFKFCVEAALSETFAVAENVPEEFQSLRIAV